MTRRPATTSLWDCELARSGTGTRTRNPRHCVSLPILLLAACYCALVPQCAAELDVDVRVENRTGAEKRDWPVFLKVHTLFGNNLDLAAISPKGFHVFDAAGGEVPHMLRSMPPAWSIGSADVIVIIPTLADGAAAAFRVTNTQTDGRPQQFDLLANPNNLLPNPGFEANAAGVPEGYKQISDKGGTISYETSVKHSGKQSLLLTFAPGTALTLQSLAPVTFQKEGRYHFSLWARTDNMAYMLTQPGWCLPRANLSGRSPSASRRQKQSLA